MRRARHTVLYATWALALTAPPLWVACGSAEPVGAARADADAADDAADGAEDAPDGGEPDGPADLPSEDTAGGRDGLDDLDGASDLEADAAPDVDTDALSDVLDGDHSDTTDLDTSIDPVPDADLDLPPPPLTIDYVYAVENATNVLSAFVGWAASEPAGALLEVSCDGELVASYTTDASPEEREVFVMGFVPDALCVVSLTATASDGRTTTRTVDYETPALDWPTTEVVTSDPTRYTPGWTFFTLNDATRVVPNRVAAVDHQGRYRWLFESPFTLPGTANEVGILPEGVLIGGGDDGEPIIASWDGRVIWQGHGLRNHHEIIYLPEENAFAVMQRDFPDCPTEDGHHYLSLYDRATDSVTFDWALCAHFTPMRVFHSWDHLNAVAFWPDRQTFLISSRNQNSLFRVDRATGEILWTMGYGTFIGGGFRGDFAMSQADRFQAQHAPELLPSGNILLFDNGSARLRPYSRAIEIAYDEEARTAEVVWQYVPEPRIFSDIWGDVDQLDDGNRLITFGVRSLRELTHITEVQGTDAVWDLTLEAGWGTYRSVRLVDPVLVHEPSE
jgi:hypothetical protein